MKSLDERQQQRAEQRKLLAHGGVVPLPGKEGETSNDGAGSNADQFESMTVDQLKAWAKENGAEVPKDKVKRDDILLYVRNYAAYLEANPAQGGKTNPEWNGQ